MYDLSCLPVPLYRGKKLNIMVQKRSFHSDASKFINKQIKIDRSERNLNRIAIACKVWQCMLMSH